MASIMLDSKAFTVCMERLEERGKEDKWEEMQSFFLFSCHGRNYLPEPTYLQFARIGQIWNEKMVLEKLDPHKYYNITWNYIFAHKIYASCTFIRAYK